MVKIRGVVLGTIEEQRRGGKDGTPNHELLDITGVSQSQWLDVPVTVEFDSDKQIGTARVYVENGRLMAECEIDYDDALGLGHKLALGATGRKHADRMVFSIERVTGVGVTNDNKDKSIPDYEVLE